MPSFGASSKKRLNECHPDLKKIFEVVVETWDCSVLCGHRPKEEQDAAYETGRSKVKWPRSKHNSHPSRAVDVAPYPIDWSDIERFADFGFFVLGVAKGLKASGEITHNIRWGADWNRNYDNDDERFLDYPHFEIDE